MYAYSVYVIVKKGENEIIPIYVPHEMFWNEGLVTITTTKLNIQLDAVLKAFAGARMRNPTISAGYSPISKIELTMNRCKNQAHI